MVGEKDGVVVLFSGGVESTLLLSRAPEGSVALHLGYQHPAKAAERAACNRIAAMLGKPLVFRHVPIDIAPHPVTHERPGRNQLFITMAVMAAQQWGLKEVWLGACKDDHRDYPDCRPHFITAMNAVMNLCYLPNVAAPLVLMSKAEIWAELPERFHSEVQSCYFGIRPTNCQCASCRSNDVGRGQ